MSGYADNAESEYKPFSDIMPVETSESVVYTAVFGNGDCDGNETIDDADDGQNVAESALNEVPNDDVFNDETNGVELAFISCRDADSLESTIRSVSETREDTRL